MKDKFNTSETSDITSLCSLFLAAKCTSAVSQPTNAPKDNSLSLSSDGLGIYVQKQLESITQEPVIRF
jgi:hypothetical protein